MWAIFLKWRWVLAGALLVVYSVGVWEVSSRMQAYACLQAQQAVLQQQLESQDRNEQLKSAVSASIQKSLQDQATLNRKQTHEIIQEVLKDPVYKSCRVTDGVRESIQRKRDNQPK